MFWITLFSIIITFIVIGVILGKGEVDRRNIVQERINQIFQERQFNPSQLYSTEIKDRTIAYDENQKRFCIISKPTRNNGEDYIVKEFRQEEIMQSEVIEDGETVTKTSRSSQLAGAAIGSVLAGVPGSIIGGLSGKTSSKDEVKSIKLQLVVDDIDSPIINFPFLDKDSSIKKESALYRNTKERALHWQKLIEVLIKRNNQ